jgi:AcrR family transcriptional regulator
MKSTRSYSMAVRAERAAATKQRIVEAARSLASASPAGFTLDEVAERAGVSVQTVLRIFGTKDALFVATVGSSRSPRVTTVAEAADPGSAVAVLFDDYEEIGMRVIGMLAEEHRSPEIARILQAGRADHRGWVENTWAPQLKAFRGAARRKVVLALLAATDVYLWKLLRIDLSLPRAEAEAVIRRLVVGALVRPKEK